MGSVLLSDSDDVIVGSKSTTTDTWGCHLGAYSLSTIADYEFGNMLGRVAWGCMNVATRLSTHPLPQG